MTDPRHTLLTILNAALIEVSPNTAVRRHVVIEKGILQISGKPYPLSEVGNIYVIGAGKGAAPMVSAIEDILGERVTAGLVCVKYHHTIPLKRVELREAAHPLPDVSGENAALEMLKLAKMATSRDLVICVITGGASALTPALVEGITLEDAQGMTSQLLKCGATIHEINTIRKHISCFGGGKLAQAVAPASLVSLIISDVVGDMLDVIASGPTAPDVSTYTDCLDIIYQYDIARNISPSICQHLLNGSKGGVAETPFPEDPAFERVQNVLVATNRQALAGASEAAKHFGYKPIIVTSEMSGEARDRAAELVALARRKYRDLDQTGPVCLLAGGETTVTVTGSGLGGRNQEMALAASLHLVEGEDISMLCVGTDGTDGPTDAAGGFACPQTLRSISDKNISPKEYLANNDAYHFLMETESLIKTGPTLTNVMDIVAILVGSP